MRTLKDKLKLTQHDILEAFGDCPASLQIINRIIREGQALERELEFKRYENIDRYGENAKLINMIVDSQYKQEIGLLKRMRWLKEAINTKGESTNGYPTREEIIKAKEYPIEMLYDFKGKRKTSKGFSSSCPWHDDSSPSFSVRNNLYKCFGYCNIAGDAIAFIQKEKGLNFIQSVRFLNGR